MSYKVRLAGPVRKIIADWNLPAELLREVYRRLTDELSEKGVSALYRMRTPLDLLAYRFALYDPANPNQKHTFLFQVKIGQDEASLAIIDAGHSCITTHPKPPE